MGAALPPVRAGAPARYGYEHQRDIADATLAQEIASAIEYQGLTPGMALC